MASMQNSQLLRVETLCRTLLHQLQKIWDEIGETDADRDKMLLELEQECLEVYKRKVDHANCCKAQLRQAIADSEAELAAIYSAMGERPVHIRQSDQNAGSLKEELGRIIPQLEEMQKRKIDRRNQFIEVLEQIQNITSEINGSTEYVSPETVVDEADISLRKLEELHTQLLSLQKEKSDRLKQIHDDLNTLELLCSVLGMNFKLAANEVHPTLCDTDRHRSISNDTIQKLDLAIQKFREVKIQRMQKLQDLATTMLELWNLMDTPIEEQQRFQNVTCNIAAVEHEVTELNALSVDFLNGVEAEVARLEELKSSKMKELVLKKRLELEEICKKTHLVPESDSNLEDVTEAIESGAMDAATILEQIELQIARVKEEAFSRKEILEKAEKWLSACDEECWVEEYNRDQNRYNAGKGSHLILKRAEKARALINKLPGMVETLASKTIAWEHERGIEFLYDDCRLLSMLEEYSTSRQEKEEERRRLRDQKRLQGQQIVEQEALYGAKLSPAKPQSVKKLGPRSASSKRLVVGATMLQTPQTPRASKKFERTLQNENANQDVSPVVKRGLDVANPAVRKHPLSDSNANELEPQTIPNPFEDHKTNVTNTEDDGEPIRKTLPCNDLWCTMNSSETTVLGNEANGMAASILVAEDSDEEILEETEHSFEEKRHSFMHSQSQMKQMLET